MLAAVDVQQHPGQRPPRPLLPVHPALPPLGHHPRPLQQPLHPAVADLHLVLGLQLLVKVPHVQIEILLPIQPQNFLHHRHRHFFGRRFSPPPVKQPPEPELFVASRPRRICRALIPIISASCHHVIFCPMSRNITSCTFIVRSIAACV